MIIIFSVIYLIGVIWFFRIISYHCVMACMGMYDYSIKNFIIALFFPIYFIIILVGAVLELIFGEKEIDFEEFKKKKVKEYKNLEIVDGKLKKINNKEKS